MRHHRDRHQFRRADQTCRQLFSWREISYINAISIICEATGANVQSRQWPWGWTSGLAGVFLDASLGAAAAVFQGPQCFIHIRSSSATISACEGSAAH